MGVRANGVISLAFLLSGLLAGIAGVLWMARTTSVNPTTGFVPVIEGSESFDEGQIVDAIVRTDYDHPVARRRCRDRRSPPASPGRRSPAPAGRSTAGTAVRCPR